MNKNNFWNLFFGICLELVFCTLLFAPPTLAIICNKALDDCTSSTAPVDYTNSVLSAVITIFFIVGIIYFIWHIVFAGYHFIASEGDPKRYESSKNSITYSLIGLIVIFSLFALLKFVGTILGITGLESLSISWPHL